MTEFDRILQSEKQVNHKLVDPDLFIFATLTEIAHQQAQAQIRRRFKVGVALCALLIIIAAQTLALSGMSFSGVVNALANLIANYPFALTILNGALVIAVLAARRLRLI
ncbi:MAG: hypothetical protein HKN50_12945 [Gammaproteobacteria bacterium]|nr:hypothetical protein [Gammaproteobacteria bacterium]